MHKIVSPIFDCPRNAIFTYKKYFTCPVVGHFIKINLLKMKLYWLLIQI